MQPVQEIISSLPEDDLLYLVKKLTDKAGFFVSSKHLLYVVSNCDREDSQSINTEHLQLNTNVDIHAFADNQQFKSGKYNIIDFIPPEGGYSDDDLQSFLNLCSAHALYMDARNFTKFFYSLINIFQIPAEQAYRNLVGLFGELSIIKYVFEKAGKDISSYWHKTGSNAKYDFVLNRYNIEVKTSLSLDLVVEIKHSQLFNNNKNYLAVVLLEKDNSGRSLNQLIQSLLSAPNYCNNYNFAINIEKEKKRVSTNDAENEFFSVRKVVFFNSDDINPFSSIPNEVDSLSYKLDLSDKNPIDLLTIMEGYDV